MHVGAQGRIFDKAYGAQDSRAAASGWIGALRGGLRTRRCRSCHSYPPSCVCGVHVKETVTSFCRLCSAGCGIQVTIEDGLPIKVVGDAAHAVSRGYTCPKGRELPDQHTSDQRLLRSIKRTPDGGFESVGSDRAMDEISETIRRSIAEYGPRSVAIYSGTGVNRYPLASPFWTALWRCMGSSMMFKSASIDQPGKVIATSLHGRWGGGTNPLSDTDVWVLLGANPLVSMWAGTGVQGPRKALNDARRNGMKLVIVDPRRTETAAMADIHLRPRPGEDPSLLAGMIRYLLERGMEDREFCDANVAGISELRKAVEPFTLDVVQERTGIPAAEVEHVMLVLSEAEHGRLTAGTGPNFAPRGSLSEYLLLCIHSLLGFWRRPGASVAAAGVFSGSGPWKAQAVPQPPAWGVGERSRVRGLGMTPLGMPTATLADEILTEGDGQVRVLICCGSNPMLAWPDQIKTRAALEKLDLLVSLDTIVGATSELADYVIATKLTLEVAGLTNFHDGIRAGGATMNGFDEPFAMYAPPILDPPDGSDVVAEWEFFYGIAQRLGFQMEIANVPIDMTTRPSEDEILHLLTKGSRIPLDEVKTHEHGHVFQDSSLVVSAPDPDLPADCRLMVGHPVMMAQLAEVIAEHVGGGLAYYKPDEYPFRMLSRRVLEFHNSSGRHVEELSKRRPHNAAHLHPDDLASLGLGDGDLIEIATVRSAVKAIAEADADIQTGTVSIAHGFEEASTTRLLTDEHGYDPITGQPVMGGVPVRIRAASETTSVEAGVGEPS
jgi:anaerobic selenocysteine-containing dehydrogenase